MNKLVAPGKLFGRIHVPASKSDAQRAILAAALANGTSKIYGIGESEDVNAMLHNIECLGAKIQRIGNDVIVEGGVDRCDELDLNVGESGLGLRLMASVSAALSQNVRINGEGSLLQRTHPFFEDSLTQLGVHVKSNKGKLPLSIQGDFHGGSLVLDGSLSSQFLSGLLMTLPLLEEDSELTVMNLRSTPYVQMTLDTLKAFGVIIEHQNFEKFYIKGGQKYQATKYAVEGDWSGASYWLVAAALGNELTIDGLLLNSQQADKAMLDALVAANCVVNIENEGIQINGSNRKAFVFNATDCPDLFPALAVLAALTPGQSRILGVNRLANKESNRGEVLQNEFDKLGIKIDLEGDLMIIHGDQQINTSIIDSHNDHRIAMCFAIAAKFGNGLEIESSQCVNKSYPQFWTDLENVEVA